MGEVDQTGENYPRKGPGFDVRGVFFFGCKNIVVYDI